MASLPHILTSFPAKPMSEQHPSTWWAPFPRCPESTLTCVAYSTMYRDHAQVCLLGRLGAPAGWDTITAQDRRRPGAQIPWIRQCGSKEGTLAAVAPIPPRPPVLAAASPCQHPVPALSSPQALRAASSHSWYRSFLLPTPPMPGPGQGRLCGHLTCSGPLHSEATASMVIARMRTVRHTASAQ